LKRGENAYLTVYLALCITLLLSLCVTLIEGVRKNGARLEAECVTEVGLQSILAEFHREMFYQYNLFAIDSSYGTAMPGTANTERHLKEYIERNLDLDNVFMEDYFYRDFLGLTVDEASLTKISIFTDGGGAVFRRRAAEAMGDDVGLTLLEDVQSWMQTIEINGLEQHDIEKEKAELDAGIEEYDGMEIYMGEDEEPYIFTVDNPTDLLEGRKRQGILKLVLEEDSELSCQTIQSDGLIQERMRRGQINQGNVPVEELSSGEQVLERFLFQEYLLKYMSRYGAENGDKALRYQIEYLVAGGDSDAENLRTVANRICFIREAANAMYLFSDGEKRMEAQLAAELACSLTMVPELAPLLEAAILLGWAYAESIYDVKTLLSGGKIPLIKDRETWHYGLTGALQGELADGDNEGVGLAYEDYLRIFMACTDLDILTARAMNMVEADIRLTPGNGAFRLDGCYDLVEANVTIKSSHGFEFELTRQRGYD